MGMRSEDSFLNSLRAFSRRSFLKSSGATAAWAMASSSGAVADETQPLRPVPTLGDLASDRITHGFRDLYSTPATQNEWGYVKASKSVTGINALSFPPFACCGIPETAWSPGYLTTCELYLDGRLLMVSTPQPSETSYIWYPHRIVRQAVADGLSFTTQTFMPSKQRAVAQSIVVKNLASQQRTFTLGFDLRAAVTKKTEAWFVNSPGAADNRVTADLARGCLIFEAQHRDRKST